MLQAIGRRRPWSRCSRPLLEDGSDDKATLLDEAGSAATDWARRTRPWRFGQVLAIDHDDVDASKGISVALFFLERYEEALARAVQEPSLTRTTGVFWRIRGHSLFMLRA